MEDMDNCFDTPCMAAEPNVGYAATGCGYSNTLLDYQLEESRIPVGKLGFYTENPDELQIRIAEMETSVERAEQGDESEWLTADEFDKELQREFLWL